MMIRSEDVDRYETLVAQYHDEFRPIGPEETYLLQSIIDIRWRLASIPAYEAALLDLGRTEMIRQEPELANNPAPVFDMQIRLYFEKKFRNLHLQEGRLARRREREMKELREREATRKAEAKAREEQASKTAQPPAPQPNGFVLTNAEIGQFVATLATETRESLLDALFLADLPANETMEDTAQTA